MRTYPSDENVTHNKLHDYHQTVSVSANVENVVLVAYIVGRREVCPNIREICPLGFRGNLIPSFQCYAGILASWTFEEFFQFPMGYYPHFCFYSAAKIEQKF